MSKKTGPFPVQTAMGHMLGTLKKLLSPALSVLVLMGLVLPSSGAASAFQTSGLMIYFDFSNLASTADGTQLTDLSGNLEPRNGTIKGTGLTFDPVNKALVFPGGTNGTNYVELGGEFKDFSNGVSIEFEGEFGAERAVWERIFDFGSPFIEGSPSNNQFWVGHLYNTNELGVEVWIDNTTIGLCHTVGDALGAPNDRTFHKWLITIGNEGATQHLNVGFTRMVLSLKPS